MLYDPYEILELLVRGGFLAVAAGSLPDAGRVSLWLFVDGYLFEYAELTARSFSNLFGCGIIEPWKKVESPNGEDLTLYFLLGQSPLSK